ncbi:diphthine synthase-like protein, putative, partial [Bodo saltans]
YMTIHQALEQLKEVEANKQGGAIDANTTYVGVARVGSATQQVVAGSLEELLAVDFGEPLHSLIVAGDIHECEEDHVKLFRSTKA